MQVLNAGTNKKAIKCETLVLQISQINLILRHFAC